MLAFPPGPATGCRRSIGESLGEQSGDLSCPSWATVRPRGATTLAIERGTALAMLNPMTTVNGERPAGVPPEAWWVEEDEEWVLGPKDDEGREHGPIEYWRADGSLCCRCDFVHGSPHGSSTRFHQNGEVSQRATYVEGELHGTRSWFSIEEPTTENTRPQGVSELVVRSEMDYDQGDVTGVRHFDAEGRRVQPNGKVIPERPDQLPEGAWWDEDDDRWRLGRANGDAEKIGPWKVWSAEGELLERCNYEADNRHGAAWCRVADGEYSVPNAVGLQGEYVRGVRVGIWKALDRNDAALAEIDYGDAVNEDTELEFFDNDPRPAAAWLDLAGKYRANRNFGLALAALGRAAGVSGDPGPVCAALDELCAPLTKEAAAAAVDDLESVSELLDGLVAGAKASGVFRQIAIYLDHEGCTRAALDFIQAAVLLEPTAGDYLFNLAVIQLGLGDVEAARATGKLVTDEHERAFVANYCRILFPKFDFWPAREEPHTHYDELPDAPSRSLDDVRALVGKYARRIQQIREQLLSIPSVAAQGDVPWLPPDLSALVEGAPELGVDRFEIPDPDDPDDPYVVDIDETLELEGASIKSLLRWVRGEWHALCWLCWSCGLDKVALPERINPPPQFGQAAGMAPARLWRCRDRRHMRGMGAQMQGIPGFAWEGIDIDELPSFLTGLAEEEYADIQAMMYWLTDAEVRSPWQDNLRGS